MGFGYREAPMIRLLVAMLLLAGLGACATPASYTSMIPELASADLGPGPAPSYRGAITVAPVSIGNDTSAPWRSQIGSAAAFASTRPCWGWSGLTPASR